MSNVAAVLYSYYPQDPRPRREAEALVEEGIAVDVICLRSAGQLAEETINGVHIHRLAQRRFRGGKLLYIRQYLSFIFRAFLKLTGMHLRKRYGVVHVHNMPDILVFSALVPKLSGSRVILDLHDPMPELYMTKFLIREDHIAIRLLKFLEKWSIRFADIVITPNIAFRKRFISRGCPAEKLFIVMNSPQDSFTRRDQEEDRSCASTASQKLVVMFHGSIFERHGLDTALDAMVILRKEIPNLEMRVYGDGDYVQEFLGRIAELDLTGIVHFGGQLTHQAVKKEVLASTVGIVPNKLTPFTNINMPTRIFEYLSLNKPVIVSRTDGVQDYFDDNSIIFFDAGNAQSLADAIRKVHCNGEHVQQILDRGLQIYRKHLWAQEKSRLLAMVRSLLQKEAYHPAEADAE
ncbi:MAG TPA: glycosyltransferase family 4 protein [Geomonas sp.]|nr:glycosyltransferase family 4 protein [Geomonas sp.]